MAALLAEEGSWPSVPWPSPPSERGKPPHGPTGPRLARLSYSPRRDRMIGPLADGFQLDSVVRSPLSYVLVAGCAFEPSFI